MLYAGKVVSTLPKHINIGKYVLNLADRNIYVGTILNTNESSWVQVNTSTGDATKPVGNGEIDYFFDFCKNNLLTYNSVTSLWEITKLSGQFDDGSTSYFILNGKLIIQQPLQVVNIINSFPIYNEDVANGYVLFPLQTVYSAITVDKRSAVNNFAVYTSDTYNQTGQLILIDIQGDTTPAITYFYYEGITKVYVQLMFTYENTNAPVTATTTTITLTNIVRDNDGMLSSANVQTDNNDGNNGIITPELNSNGVCTGKFINNSDKPFTYNFSFAVPAQSINGNPLPISVYAVFSIDDDNHAIYIPATYGPSSTSAYGYVYTGSAILSLPRGAIGSFTGFAPITTTPTNSSYISPLATSGSTVTTKIQECPPVIKYVY